MVNVVLQNCSTAVNKLMRQRVIEIFIRLHRVLICNKSECYGKKPASGT